MPVDLSRIGLEGIETAQRTLNSMAQREALASQTDIAEAEEARKSEDRAIDQWAAQAFDSIGKGEGLPKGSGGLSLNVDENDPASVFDAVGQRYTKAGAPKRAKEFIEAGMKLRKDQFDIDKGRDDHAKVRLDNMVVAGTALWNGLGQVGNQNELDLFWDMLPDDIVKILGEDNMEGLKNIPYSPDWINMARSKALSVKDQATLALTERGQNRADRNADLAASRAKALIELGRANLEERRKENARKDKADGPNVGKAPTGDERKTAQRSIVNNIELLGGKMPAEDSPEYDAVLNMTDDIVGRAKVITSENKGLTFPEAVEQAVAEADAAGDFGILEPAVDEPWYNIKANDKPAVTGYKRKGTKPDNPIPLPADKSKWVKGRYYMKNGKVGRYGTDFN